MIMQLLIFYIFFTYNSGSFSGRNAAVDVHAANFVLSIVHIKIHEHAMCKVVDVDLKDVDFRFT